MYSKPFPSEGEKFEQKIIKYFIQTTVLLNTVKLVFGRTLKN